MLIKQKHVSIKITNSKLQKRNKDLGFLLDMSNFLSLTLNLETLLHGALSKVLKFFHLEAGRIYLRDIEKACFYLAAHQGLEPVGLETLGFDEGFSGKAARTKSFIAQHVSELKDKRRADLLLSKGLKIVICVPLIVMNKVEGVMNLASKRIIDLDQEKIDLSIAIGNQIAVAANNAMTHKDLQDKITALQEKKDTIKFFAYSISHDLKSPAVAICGLAKRLKEKKGNDLDETGKAYCDQILKATTQMLALVEELNAYIAAKESPLYIERISIQEITETVRKEFEDRSVDRNIRWSEPDNLPEVHADRLSVLRVFRNLVDNSLKYGGRQMTTIKIGYEETGEHHVFSFSDNGVGISGPERDKVFDSFHRNGASKGTTGSGLGLAIVKKIAERHRGNAWLAPETKEGVTFYISIAKALEFRGTHEKG